MRDYFLRRLLLLLPTLIGVTLVLFLMMHCLPGDPVTNMMGAMFSQEDAAHLRQGMGLNKPLLTLGLPRAALLTRLIRASLLEMYATQS